MDIVIKHIFIDFLCAKMYLLVATFFKLISKKFLTRSTLSLILKVYFDTHIALLLTNFVKVKFINKWQFY